MGWTRGCPPIQSLVEGDDGTGHGMAYCVGDLEYDWGETLGDGDRLASPALSYKLRRLRMDSNDVELGTGGAICQACIYRNHVAGVQGTCCELLGHDAIAATETV
jgi:hypothetical protein